MTITTLRAASCTGPASTLHPDPYAGRGSNRIPHRLRSRNAPLRAGNIGQEDYPYSPMHLAPDTPEYTRLATGVAGGFPVDHVRATCQRGFCVSEQSASDPSFTGLRASPKQLSPWSKLLPTNASSQWRNARLLDELQTRQERARNALDWSLKSQASSGTSAVANMSHELENATSRHRGYAELMQEGFYEPQGNTSMTALTRHPLQRQAPAGPNQHRARHRQRSGLASSALNLGNTHRVWSRRVRGGHRGRWRKPRSWRSRRTRGQAAAGRLKR